MENQTTSPRRRLRALRAIPDNDRTDEQWDELNELEIMLAPANRIAAPMEPAKGRQERANGARGPGKRVNGAKAASTANNASARKPVKRVRKKPRGAGNGSTNGEPGSVG
jgi:hypothetical protein